MKPTPIIALALILAVSTLAHATRFEFETFPFAGPRPLGEENTAFIETTTDTGENVPILEAVSAFQWRGLDSGTAGFQGGNLVELPNIIAPTFTSLEGLGLNGTMSWTTTTLGGSFWFITSPVFEAPEHTPPLLGATRYILSDARMDSFWPLEYFFNEASQGGRWRAVPEAGATILLLSLAVCALLGLKPFLSEHEA